MKRIFAVVLAMSVLAAVPACAQQFPLLSDDNTSSLGSFKIQVAPQFTWLFAGCPNPPWNNPILTSPTLYDQFTKVGRSDALLDGSAADINGVAVGTAGTIVSEGMLFAPPGFPCQGVAGCTSGANTREIHTEVRSLKMAGGGAMVRAGLWYDNANVQNPPSKISPGEVESHSGPGGAPANDLPASSFFDIFVQADLPACGGFPGATVYNKVPLIVKNFNLTALPPRVVYLHDTSSVVPILFLNANPGKWNADDILGYFVLAGHGIGFTNSPSDISEFNNFMNSQKVTCVTTSTTASADPPASSASAKTSVKTTNGAVAQGPTQNIVAIAPNPCTAN